jgi:hypothetical protein
MPDLIQLSVLGKIKNNFFFLFFRLGSISASFADSEEDEEDEEEEEEDFPEIPVSKTGKSGSRVRTLISDQQLSVLKNRYSLNPKPRRDELLRIASEIGHPFKVVKVHFL